MKTISLFLLLTLNHAEAQIRSDGKEYYDEFRKKQAQTVSKSDLEEHQEELKELREEFDAKSYESLKLRQEMKTNNEQFIKLEAEIDALAAKKGLTIEEQKKVDAEIKQKKKEREDLSNANSRLKWQDGKKQEELREMAAELKKAKAKEQELMKALGEEPKAEELADKVNEVNQVNQPKKKSGSRTTASQETPRRELKFKRPDLSKPWTVESDSTATGQGKQ